MRVLEFPAVLEVLAGEATSPLGRVRALALRPSPDPELVRQRLGETRECRALLAQGPAPASGLVPALTQAADIRAALGRASVAGARLSAADLGTIADTVEAAADLRRHVRSSGLPLVHLRAHLDDLRPPLPLAREIRRCIGPDGAVVDAASPVLSRLRAQARQAREDVREALQALLAAPQLQGVIAEPVITLRNDRYVIPVLAGYRSVLPGVVQDQSGSGHTLFLEPLAVVEQNNAIRRLEREAEAEADRILGELTAGVRGAGADLAVTVEALANLDLFLAKARLAERWEAAEPRIVPEGALRLRQARHPLLLEVRYRRGQGASADPVVPIDLVLTPEVRVLVITGPNAGGKTVALKTAGLLALMVQAGLFIPASPDSDLPVFDGIYADIGDEQSITADLSTFSAHITRLTTILEKADRQSLILVDEIGAGTDPGEGAALGNAVLEALASVGAHVLATTHLDGIKVFVAQDPRMVNGAVEFDLDRMRPAYKLHIGLPGRSFAIDVACRLGIPPTIVQRARELVGDSGTGVATLLSQLHAMERRRADDAAQAAADRAAALAARETAEDLVKELREQLARLRARARQLVAEIAAEARRRAEAAVASLRRGAAAAEARRAIGTLAEIPDEQLAPLGDAVAGWDDEASLSAVLPGQSVWVRHLGQVGTVLGEPATNGLVEIQLPLGKTRVPLASLGPTTAAAPRPQGGVSWTAGAGDSLSSEINVIGCTVEEATERVRRYLEDAMLGNLTRVRIIHGKGTGRLRRGIAELLKDHPLVAGHQLASFEEGGAGATVVELGTREAGTSAPGEAHDQKVDVG